MHIQLHIFAIASVYAVFLHAPQIDQSGLETHFQTKSEKQRSAA